MLFNSLQFAVFLPAVVFLYFLVPYRFRWTLLLAASYYFYMCWKVEYILLIIASTLIDYFAALQMDGASSKRKKKLYLWLSLCSNLGILFGFKYLNFTSDSLRDALNHFNIFYDIPTLNVLLPVGISFYTFQTLSYTVDVYRGRQKPERHLGIFALYVSFFPQLVAGPIERSTRLLPQFFVKNDFSYHRAVEGGKLILWGFFKKLVVADRAAIYVNAVYNNPGQHSGLTFVVATVFFAFQIYCDFSGYSDIAIGSAKVMGYDLMINFRTPYFSKSIKEFWSRWHISLSTWFRDYLYIPLGGNRVAKVRWYFNLFVTFLVSGLWHGANWTFVVWGAIHGTYLVAAIMTEDLRKKLVHISGLDLLPSLRNLFATTFTFVLVCFAWIFFRANSLSDALHIVHQIALLDGPVFLPSGADVTVPFYSAIAIMILLAVEVSSKLSAGWIRQPGRFRAAFGHFSYAALALLIVLLGVFDGGQFIYFQF